MYISCPRCHSSNVSRVHQASAPSVGSQVGMTALGSQIAKHLSLPMPFGQIAGGLIGSLLGEVFEPPRPVRLTFYCNECQSQFV